MTTPEDIIKQSVACTYAYNCHECSSYKCGQLCFLAIQIPLVVLPSAD